MGKKGRALDAAWCAPWMRCGPRVAFRGGTCTWPQPCWKRLITPPFVGDGILLAGHRLRTSWGTRTCSIHDPARLITSAGSNSVTLLHTDVYYSRTTRLRSRCQARGGARQPCALAPAPVQCAVAPVSGRCPRGCNPTWGTKAVAGTSTCVRVARVRGLTSERVTYGFE